MSIPPLAFFPTTAASTKLPIPPHRPLGGSITAISSKGLEHWAAATSHSRPPKMSSMWMRSHRPMRGWQVVTQAPERISPQMKPSYWNGEVAMSPFRPDPTSAAASTMWSAARERSAQATPSPPTTQELPHPRHLQEKSLWARPLCYQPRYLPVNPVSMWSRSATSSWALSPTAS